MNNNKIQQENSRLMRDLNPNDSSTFDRAVEYATQIVPRRNTSLSYGNISLPESVKQAIAMGDANSVQLELDFLRSALTMVRKAQLQDIANYCEDYLKNSQENRGAKTLESQMNRAAQARDQIDRTFEDLINTIVEKLEAASQNKSPMLLRRERAL
jgi:hypothetical protein